MRMVLSLLLVKLSMSRWLFILIACPATTAAVGLSGVKQQGCNQTCGNLTVPYPFGIGIECAANLGLNITCNSSYTPPRPFIRNGSLEIVSITESEVRIKTFLAETCYNSSGIPISLSYEWTRLPNQSYTFSFTKNKFFSVGCNTNAIIRGLDAELYTSGCVSFCRHKESIENGSCSGMGCCQIDIPKNLTYFWARVDAVKIYWENEPWNTATCSHAFLGDKDEYKFQLSDITDDSFVNNTVANVPVVLDWVVGQSSCQEAQIDLTSFACQSTNSTCVDSDNGPGYRCKCKDGYEGNPYLENGCEDINECEDQSKNECLHPENCVNTQGGHYCTCPKGMHQQEQQSKQVCIPEREKVPWIKITLGCCLGLSLLLVGIFFLHSGLRKRKLAKLRETFFEQNGGLLLQQNQISSSHKSSGATRIYTAEELEKATNNYDESYIIGEGGNGTVYRGVLPPDNKIVAIKKSKIVDKTQIKQFINEVIILTQINHKNVVKLLGCCLETQVPSLVYEFISNGTLYDHIHNRPNGGIDSSKFSWHNCLRIATESSRALAYLHSAASIPIIHRDVKTANILLDDNYSAKVADFGASALIPLDQAQVATILQGTPGYLDPESYQTGRLTEKSDVYSFGVVLAEILTGKTPVSLGKSDVRRSLATYFISAMKENALLQIVDDRLVDEAGREQLYVVAELAVRCLAWNGEERPTMKDVLEELEGLMKLVERHPWAQENTEETVSLLDDHLDTYPSTTFSLSMGESSQQYSMNSNISLMSPLNLPR